MSVCFREGLQPAQVSNASIRQDTGPNGWRKPAVKEDGQWSQLFVLHDAADWFRFRSVSNSSSTTTGCEPSVCEESEASDRVQKLLVIATLFFFPGRLQRWPETAVAAARVHVQRQ